MQEVPYENVFEPVGLPHSGVRFSRAWKNPRITAARFRSQQYGLVKRLDIEDAYLVIARVNTPGLLNIFDLNDGPACCKERPFDDLHIHIPRAVLNNVADEANAPQISRLHAPDGWDTSDPVVGNIQNCIVESIERAEAVSQLFVDHTLMALLVHLARTYGGMRDGARRRAGGLAPWQERRAKEMIAADLSGAVSVGQIARQCELSESHFTRSFKQSAGLTPHEWLQACRVDRAKTLLAQPDPTLATIAVACGFADQSHFTKVFSRVTGSTPGNWRRHSRNG